jgi:hemerythrin-like domain-containing protein
MSDPIAQLQQEHRRIELVVDALQSFGIVAESGGDPRPLASFVDVLRGLVEGDHHAREEELLFSALIDDGGLSAMGGPIAVLHVEHAEARRLLRRLAELAAIPSWGREHRRVLGATARAYAALLCEHMAKEDRVVYPLAASRLSAEAAARLSRRFAAWLGRDVERRSGLDRLAAGLVSEYGTQRRLQCSCCVDMRA